LLVCFSIYCPGKPGHRHKLNVLVWGFTSRNKLCNYCSRFLTTTTLRGVSDVISCSNKSQNVFRARRLGAVRSPTQYAVRSDGQPQTSFSTVRICQRHTQHSCLPSFFPNTAQNCGRIDRDSASYRVLVRKPEGKRRLGRPRRRWEVNTVKPN